MGSYGEQPPTRCRIEPELKRSEKDAAAYPHCGTARHRSWNDKRVIGVKFPIPQTINSMADEGAGERGDGRGRWRERAGGDGVVACGEIGGGAGGAGEEIEHR